MAKRNTSIRINGRHYDALTGALLSDVVSSAHHVSAKVTKSLDGVVGGRQAVATTLAVPQKAASSPEAAAPKPRPAKTVRPHAPATNAQAHHAKPSATLMRSAVAKPQTASLKRHSKIQSSTLATATRMYPVKITTKASVYAINPQRLARAAQVSLSPQISRFAREVTLAAPAAVQDTLAAINKALVIPRVVTPARVIYRPDVTPARRPSATNTADIFERALQMATSHEQPAPIIRSKSKKSRRLTTTLRRRMVSYSAGAVAVLAIAGFFGMQNMDSIQFRLAANKAGFSATMPSYAPHGFAVDSVRSYNGYVGVKYIADNINGSRSYAITEKPSTWSNDALLDSILASGNDTSYRVVEKAGRTVYVYGNNQAAWVSNGILYQLGSTSELGNHEIGQIAASM